ncbi:histidine kinase, partial [bacterium LRH843]|nr:histidine kinase [bacterium LRH843]
DAARTAERTRIAREMHDVLAHRLSMVSLHAGALAHRRTASPDEIRDALEVVRAGARDALVDLREILGVLRDPDADPS